MLRAIIVVLIIGLGLPVFADDNVDAQWTTYTKAYMAKDCKTVLKLLGHLTKIDPDRAHIEKAYDYEKGRCLPIDTDKAIHFYQMVSSKKLDNMSALNLTHLLFLKAQSNLEKQHALSGVRNILLKEIPTVKTSAELKKYLEVLYPNSQDFLSALEGEFAYIKSLEQDDELKLLEIQKFIADDRLHTLADYWLTGLRSKGNNQAYFLSAKLFNSDFNKRKWFLSFAAKGGHPKAQHSLANIYETEDTRASKMFAYYWNLKAKQNGLNVDQHLARLSQSMSKSDIAAIKDEASKETPSLPF